MGKRVDALKQALKVVKFADGVKSVQLHVFTLRTDDQFPSGVFISENTGNGIFSIRGFKDGIFQLAGMAFDAMKFTQDKAGGELSKLLSALPALDVSTMTLEDGRQPEVVITKNFTPRFYTDGDQQFVDMLNVQFISNGIWQSRQGDKSFLEENLDRMAENHKTLFNKVSTHFSKEHEQAGPRFGIPTNLRRVGMDMFTDIIRVPLEFYRQIEAGEWPRVSAEIVPTWEDASTGDVYKDVFRGLTVLGVKEPAATSVPPLISFELVDQDREFITALASGCKTETVEFASGKPKTKETPEMEKTAEEIRAELDIELEAEREKHRTEMHAERVQMKVETLLEAQKIAPGEVDGLTKDLVEMGSGAGYEFAIKQLDAKPKIEVKTELTKGGDPVPPKEDDKRSPDEILLAKANDRASKMDQSIPWRDRFEEAMISLERDPNESELVEMDRKSYVGDVPKDVLRGA